MSSTTNLPSWVDSRTLGPPSPQKTPVNHPSPTQFSKPSSATEGFFQNPPVVLNQLHDDQAFVRCLHLFLPASIRDSVTPELSAFGDQVIGKSVLDLVADAEKHPPYLKTWDSWGRRRDDLVTSEGWRRLSEMGIREGMVSMGYENKYLEFSRVYHFAKYHLWSGSAAWTTCPSLMTDGVASLLRKHLSDPALDGQLRAVLRSAYDRITSRDPTFAWVTGQWMTERAGGSDVSQTETLARYAPHTSSRAKATDGMPLGPWVIDGFKWFSSATDCNMAVFLARTPKGVSTFFAPMRRTLTDGPDPMGYENELNGIHIQRLKQKLGTRALPTGELELKGVRAYLIGEEGRGTKEIATVLNIARIHNAATAMGLWGRGLGIVRAFARCRKVGLRPLWEKAAYMRALSKMHVEYRGYLMLTLFIAALLGIAEQPLVARFEGKESGRTVAPTKAVLDPQTAEHLLRLLTPALKGLTAKKAIAGLAECMESIGGVGYLENEDMQFNIARLFRDANVCSIWEGTTDMMAHDVLRVVYGKTSNEVMTAMDQWIQRICQDGASNRSFWGAATTIMNAWKEWKNLIQTLERGEVEMRSRELMERLGSLVIAALLLLDACRDDDWIARQVLDSWISEGTAHEHVDGERWTWRNTVKSDLAVVFGTALPVESTAKL